MAGIGRRAEELHHFAGGDGSAGQGEDRRGRQGICDQAGGRRIGDQDIHGGVGGALG